MAGEQPGGVTEQSKRESLLGLLQQLKGQTFNERLGIGINAAHDDIRMAFRKKTNNFHPDNKPAGLRDVYDEIYKLITEAFIALAKAPKKDSIVQPSFESKNPIQSRESVEAAFEKMFAQELEKIGQEDADYGFEAFLRLRTKNKSPFLKEHRMNISAYTFQYALKSLEDILKLYGVEAFELEKEQWVKEYIMTEEEASAILNTVKKLGQ